MKSTRKHELQTNELADAIGRAVERSRSYHQHIAYMAIAVIVIVAAVIYYGYSQGATQMKAADAFLGAQMSADTTALRDFLGRYPDTPQAPAAKMLLAGRLVAEAMHSPVEAGENPKAKAAASLSDAKKLYAEVAAASEALAPMAQLGLALAMVQEGDVEKGRVALDAVEAKWPDSVAAAAAKAHLELLANYQPIAFSNEPLDDMKKPEEAKPGEPQPAATPPAEAVPEAKAADVKPAEALVPAAVPAAPKAPPSPSPAPESPANTSVPSH